MNGPRSPRRWRSILGLAAVVWAAPQPAFAHSGHCTRSDTLTTFGIGTALGLVLFRPWRRSEMSRSARWSRWVLPVALTGAVTLGACAPKSQTATVRPDTAARLEILQPGPNQTLGPNFLLNLNLMGAKVVPASVTGGPLKPDEGHIHVTLDGKLVSMTYGTSQDMKDIAPGPHSLQAEFVATDHAPFRNRVIAAVAFEVSPEASPS